MIAALGKPPFGGQDRLRPSSLGEQARQPCQGVSIR